MPAFTVTSVIDHDTFEVFPHWKWNYQTGTRVRFVGYDGPELHTCNSQAAKEKLSRLIFGEQVELGIAHKVDRSRLVCEVYLRNKNLVDYFPKYQ
jgi:endonuclease YncB( thermonuclease family)